MKLYEWQQAYLADLPANVIMTCETGTGKTFMSLCHALPQLPILVIAPPAKVNSQDWQELGAELGRSVTVVSFGKVARTPVPTKDYVLIVDEVHYIKSATSKRAKAVIALARSEHCKQFIGLSATAIPNGYIDLQTYGIIFGWWKHKTDFLYNYVLIDRSRGYPRILGYRQEDKLKQLWNGVAFGLDKKHLHLPDLINITTTINLTPSQRDIYNMMKSQRMLADGTLLDTPAKLHATLRQHLSLARVEALEALLDDTDEHILVFYIYNSSREAILNVATKYKREIYEQSGHASRLPATIPSKPSLTLLQYQSGSAGLNLQYAPISVFYEPSYSYMDTEQAKGRNYRGGQEKIVRHYWFKVARTIDTAVYACLERKQDFNDSMEYDEPVHKVLDMI
jgi:SNF2 family DNA or RNA helicase